MRVNMSEKVYWEDHYSGRVATMCEVQDKPTYSRLLDSEGNPMPYEKRAVGFDLTPKRRVE